MSKDQLVARTPEEVRDALDTPVHFDSNNPDMFLSKGAKGALIGALNKHLGGDAHRHMVLGWLFGRSLTPLSSKNLSDSDWYRLQEWVAPYKDEDKWRVSDVFRVEAALILSQVLYEYSMAQHKVREQIRQVLEGEPSDLIAETVGKFGGVVTEVDDEDDFLRYGGKHVKLPQSYSEKDRILPEVTASKLNKRDIPF